MNKYQKSFIKQLIQIRDDAIEMEPEELIGCKYSDITYNLMKGYFAERISRIPLKMPSPYMNFVAFSEYLNDEVLNYIYEENTEHMTIDWRHLYVCRSLYFDGSDKENDQNDNI